MAATLTFLGAARTVTGSRYLLETLGAKILIDCGLFQERKNLGLNWERYGLEPSKIDAVVLTHGHMDHCGWLPKLVKDGFRGVVHCTSATADLVPIILRDIAKIQMEDARTKARRHVKEKRSGVRPVVPLYDQDDAEKAIARLRAVAGLGEKVEVAPGVVVEWRENGHILGATWLGVEAEGMRIVFSGDIGRWDRPILNDPVPPERADFLVIESTYGDRDHIEGDLVAQMREILAEAADRGGNVLIPSFSVERAQELLYVLSKLGETGELHFRDVYLDSPMASRVSELFKRHPEACDEEMLALMRAGKSPFAFAELTYVETADQSRQLNDRAGGAIIIAGNGMCTGGRIKHHLVHHLEDPKTTVVFVGFQAAGTLGRHLLDGDKEVRLFNRPLRVGAAIKRLYGISGHADRNELLRWAETVRDAPARCFVTHGDTEAAEALSGGLAERLGWSASVPSFGERAVLEPPAPR
jgi:metallo-beta-lactamase family protein